MKNQGRLLKRNIPSKEMFITDYMISICKRNKRRTNTKNMNVYQMLNSYLSLRFKKNLKWLREINLSKITYMKMQDKENIRKKHVSKKFKKNKQEQWHKWLVNN